MTSSARNPLHMSPCPDDAASVGPQCHTPADNTLVITTLLKLHGESVTACGAGSGTIHNSIVNYVTHYVDTPAVVCCVRLLAGAYVEHIPCSPASNVCSIHSLYVCLQYLCVLVRMIPTSLKFFPNQTLATSTPTFLGHHREFQPQFLPFAARSCGDPSSERSAATAAAQPQSPAQSSQQRWRRRRRRRRRRRWGCIGGNVFTAGRRRNRRCCWWRWCCPSWRRRKRRSGTAAAQVGESLHGEWRIVFYRVSVFVRMLSRVFSASSILHILYTYTGLGDNHSYELCIVCNSALG